MMMLDTITKNKRRIIGLLIIVVTVFVLIPLAARHNRKVKARAVADEIITGQRVTNDRYLKKTIASLLRTKSWIWDMTEQDFQRVERLSDLRNEKQISRLRNHRTIIRARADRIIAGEQPATEGEIHTLLYNLQMTTLEARIVLKLDGQRLEQLRDMHNEMRKSRGLPPWAPFDPNWSRPPRATP
jgi:hypothetical protein